MADRCRLNHMIIKFFLIAFTLLIHISVPHDVVFSNLQIYENFHAFKLPFTDLLPFTPECDHLRGPERRLQLHHHQGMESRALEE